MLKPFTVFIFIFLKGGNFTVIVTVSVMFSCGNFSRDIVGLETDEKKILLCEAIGHSLKLVNLEFVSILTGFCLSLQSAPTGIIGIKWFA